MTFAAGELCASIDVGTNTALLLVGRFDAHGALEVVLDTSATARLGEGLAATGRLQPAPMERAAAILGRYVERMDALGIDPRRRRAVGTAVFRRAENSSRFVERCAREHGLALEVISELDEARLGYAAVTAGLGGAGPAVVDVGGGSSEVVRDGGALRASAPIGAVVLTERYLGLAGQPALHPGGVVALWSEVRGACAELPPGRAGESVVLIGGTAVNLACLELAPASFNVESVEGRSVDALAARRQAQRLFELSIEERAALPIEADRAAILPAGLACIAGVLERLGPSAVHVSSRGVRYGVLHETFGPAGAAPRASGRR